MDANPADPERKERARTNFRTFCEDYFPETFRLAWSPDHLKVIAKIERAGLHGGLFAMAMPRGSGKSTIAECACLWAILFGHQDFVALIGSDEGHASDMLESIKMELDGNDQLLADFPEVVYPIQKLDGIANRCSGQLYRGARTHIGWTAKEIVLPTIPGSAASGAIIKVAGLTGGIRGMKYKRRDGKAARPSLVVLDDPQTDESARSLSQCATRESILAGAVLGLAGPGRKMLTADQIAAKTNGYPRAAVPLACQHLTMFIDVQQDLLFYTVVAWEPSFTGYVIEYRAYPDQGRPYFTLRDARNTLGLATQEAGLEGAIFAGLKAVTTGLLGHSWRREDGAHLKIGRCLIDANWGQSTDVVYEFCRQSPHSAILMPSHGRFVGASSRPFSEYRKSPGETLGFNWFVPNVDGKRAIRHVLFDTNFWKSFVQARLKVALGDRGCLSLYGDKAETHRLLAEHLTSEYRVPTIGRGRTVDEWKIRPERSDNHWLDCVVGSAVAASMLGVSLEETGPATPRRKPRMRLSEMQQQGWERRGYTRSSSYR